jgi:hypothetical protein
MKLQEICPGGASIKSGLGGLLAEDCHSCSQRVIILQIIIIEVVAKCLSHPGEPIAGPTRAGRQRVIEDRMQEMCEDECC